MMPEDYENLTVEEILQESDTFMALFERHAEAVVRFHRVVSKEVGNEDLANNLTMQYWAGFVHDFWFNKTPYVEQPPQEDGQE